MKPGREIYYRLEVNKMKEIDKWLNQFRKIWEARFDELDKVLQTIKIRKMEARSVVAERIFNVDKKMVWRAITEKELMKQWYFDLAEFKPEVGFKFMIHVKKCEK